MKDYDVNSSSIRVIIVPKSNRLGTNIKRSYKEIKLLFKEVNRCYPVFSKFIYSFLILFIAWLVLVF